MTGDLLFTLASPYPVESGWLGLSVSGLGDINETGTADLAVGACYEDPGSSPPSAGSAYLYTTTPTQFNLSDTVEGEDFVLTWSIPEGDVAGYWIYGASNLPYFEAGLAPDFDHILDVLGPGTLTWSSPNGVGNPVENWTYQVMAIDIAYQNALSVSNRFGEIDFGIAIQ